MFIVLRAHAGEYMVRTTAGTFLLRRSSSGLWHITPPPGASARGIAPHFDSKREALEAIRRAMR